MNQSQTTANERRDKSSDEIGLFDVLIILAKYKKRLLVAPLVAAVLSVGISLVLPNTFQATTKLLPPQQAQSGTAALLSQLGGAAGAVAGGISGLKNSNDLYMAMLKSRTVADKLIAKFDLKKKYELESMEKVRAHLAANTAVALGKDGLISVTVEDKDQKMVAQLANAYVGELLQLTKVLAVTEAGQRRVFYEQQLEQAKDNLAKVEGELKNALDQRGVISVDTESRAVLETVARLRAQASAKEIQLNSMSAFVTRDNPQYRRAEEELASLRAELAKLENGRGPSDAGDRAASPGGQSGFQNAKLLRDVKYYQMLYELLAKQYELARLDEAKDPAIVQVLDPAIEPERKAKPHRATIVLLSTAIVFLLALVSAFVAEARRSFLKTERGMAQWGELKALLSSKK